MPVKIILIKDTSIGTPDATLEFYNRFTDALRQRNMSRGFQFIRVADIGLYGHGVVLKILPDNIIYHNVQEGDIERIIDKTKTGKIVDELLYKQESRQNRIVLRNCGKIDPENLNDYIRTGGYQALSRVLKDMTPEQVIQEMKVSGLRGRGGAGYPTWMKWSLCRKEQSPLKYVICNGDEGDPGAYMDRGVLEGDPHSVIEGMIIAAYAIGATKGYFYIRAEYPLAVKRIQEALDQCHEAGFLGTGILGSKFSFRCGNQTGGWSLRLRRRNRSHQLY